MADQQIQSDALSGLAVEGGDFASLLQKEFKPKSEVARDEVSRAVQTLAIYIEGRLYAERLRNRGY